MPSRDDENDDDVKDAHDDTGSSSSSSSSNNSDSEQIEAITRARLDDFVRETRYHSTLAATCFSRFLQLNDSLRGVCSPLELRRLLPSDVVRIIVNAPDAPETDFEIAERHRVVLLKACSIWQVEYRYVLFLLGTQHGRGFFTTLRQLAQQCPDWQMAFSAMYGCYQERRRATSDRELRQGVHLAADMIIVADLKAALQKFPTPSDASTRKQPVAPQRRPEEENGVDRSQRGTQSSAKQINDTDEHQGQHGDAAKEESPIEGTTPEQPLAFRERQQEEKEKKRKQEAHQSPAKQSVVDEHHLDQHGNAAKDPASSQETDTTPERPRKHHCPSRDRSHSPSILVHKSSVRSAAVESGIPDVKLSQSTSTAQQSCVLRKTSKEHEYSMAEEHDDHSADDLNILDGHSSDDEAGLELDVLPISSYPPTRPSSPARLHPEKAASPKSKIDDRPQNKDAASPIVPDPDTDPAAAADDVLATKIIEPTEWANDIFVNDVIAALVACAPKSVSSCAVDSLEVESLLHHPAYRVKQCIAFHVIRCRRIYLPLLVSRNHWLLVVLQKDDARFDLQSATLFDPLPSPSHRSEANRLIQRFIYCYLPQFSPALTNGLQEGSTPCQTNLNDCGIFVVAFVAYHITDTALSSRSLEGRLWRLVLATLKGGRDLDWTSLLPAGVTTSTVVKETSSSAPSFDRSALPDNPSASELCDVLETRLSSKLARVQSVQRAISEYVQVVTSLRVEVSVIDKLARLATEQSSILEQSLSETYNDLAQLTRVLDSTAKTDRKVAYELERLRREYRKSSQEMESVVSTRNNLVHARDSLREVLLEATDALEGLALHI